LLCARTEAQHEPSDFAGFGLNPDGALSQAALPQWSAGKPGPEGVKNGRAYTVQLEYPSRALIACRLRPSAVRARPAPGNLGELQSALAALRAPFLFRALRKTAVCFARFDRPRAWHRNPARRLFCFARAVPTAELFQDRMRMSVFVPPAMTVRPHVVPRWPITNLCGGKRWHHQPQLEEIRCAYQRRREEFGSLPDGRLQPRFAPFTEKVKTVLRRARGAHGRAIGS